MSRLRVVVRSLLLGWMLPAAAFASSVQPTPVPSTGGRDLAPAAAPAAVPASVPAGFDPPAPDTAERAYVAARLYQAVVTCFAHREGLPDGFDFDAGFRRFLGEAFAARSRVAFDKAAMRLMGSLRNGHTGFTDTLLSRESLLPFRVLRLDGKWIVSRSGLAAGTLDPGDELDTLDGQPIDAWIADNLAFTQRSNRTESESALFATVFLWPVRFTLGLGDGRRVLIDRAGPAVTAWRGLNRADTVTVEQPRPAVVLIRIPGFNKPDEERAAVSAVASHREARAIVLDLRGNGGGDTPAHLLSALVERPYRDMIDATPLHIGTLDAWAQAGNGILDNAMIRSGGALIQPDHPIFHGRVLLLTDRFCASACEDLVLALHQSGRATILGETTYGSTGQPFGIDFPDLQMTARVGARREYGPDSAPFEGVGVAPDIPVPITRAALRSGDDAVLRRALDLASKG